MLNSYNFTTRYWLKEFVSVNQTSRAYLFSSSEKHWQHQELFLKIWAVYTKENYQVLLVSPLNDFYEFINKHLPFNLCTTVMINEVRAMASKGKFKKCHSFSVALAILELFVDQTGL